VQERKRALKSSNPHSLSIRAPRCQRLVLALALILSPCVAGEVKKPRIGKDTPEGTFLELVSLEVSAAKKVALLEHFLTIFPACDPTVTVWVYGELQERYRRAGDLDKALAAGGKILVIDPNNIDIAETNKRLAEKKGDVELANKWTAEIEAIAARIVKLPLPTDPEEIKAAQERVDYARQFVMNSDYADFTKAIGTQGPSERIAALEAFLSRVPQNPYLEQIEAAEFLAYKEMGDMDKTLAAAEKILSHNEGREDALLFVVEVNFNRKKDPKRTLALAAKFIDGMTAAPAPEGVSEHDWAQAKTRNIARAHYIIGRIYFDSEQWPSADRALRGALPLIGDEQLRAAVLNDLAWANYRMQKALEALKFYGQCAAIRGPLQDQASKSALSIKAEYHLQ
jgi:tetratricopeptide (TPR) repeat protein